MAEGAAALPMVDCPGGVADDIPAAGGVTEPAGEPQATSNKKSAAQVKAFAFILNIVNENDSLQEGLVLLNEILYPRIGRA